MIKKFLDKIEIKPSFIAALGLAAALNFAGQFFIFFAFALLHELAHLSAALLLKAKVRKLTVIPLGIAGEIQDFNFLGDWSKLFILLSGPAINIVFALILHKSHPWAATVNIALAAFNLLPIPPLDGGRIALIFLSGNMGAIPAIRLATKFGRAAALFVAAIGILQIILYPYNISLICLGYYLYKGQSAENTRLVFEFYAKITARPRILPIKTFFVPLETSLKHMLYKISWNKYYIFYAQGNNKLISMDETRLMSEIMDKGLNKSLEEALKLPSEV